MRIIRTAVLLALAGIPAMLSAQETGVVVGTISLASIGQYPAVVYIEGIPAETPASPAATPVLDVKAHAFSPRVLPILAGTTVEFSKSDGRKHFVFSPDGEKYELGNWNRGEKRTHTFQNSGVYTQLCSHHSEMVGYIVALKTPYFALTDPAGNFRIPGVPAGTWKVKVWNERLGLSQLRTPYEVRVTRGGQTNMTISPELSSAREYWLAPAPPANVSLVDRGKWLFRQKGCYVCHGPEGSRGAPNANFVAGTVPALENLAEKLMLFDPQDVKAIVGQLEQGRDLESLANSPPVPRFNVFLEQYRTVRDVIRKGRTPGKKDPKGPAPPLAMPTWEKQLSATDVNAVIAYLLTLQSWEEGAL